MTTSTQARSAGVAVEEDAVRDAAAPVDPGRWKALALDLICSTRLSPAVTQGKHKGDVGTVDCTTVEVGPQLFLVAGTSPSSAPA
jgi:hypothetical protein